MPPLMPKCGRIAIPSARVKIAVAISLASLRERASKRVPTKYQNVPYPGNLTFFLSRFLRTSLLGLLLLFTLEAIVIGPIKSNKLRKSVRGLVHNRKAIDVKTRSKNECQSLLRS